MSRHQTPPEEAIDIDGTKQRVEQKLQVPGRPLNRLQPPSSDLERTSGPDGGFHTGTGHNPLIRKKGEPDHGVEMGDLPFINGPTSIFANQTNLPKPSTNPPTPPSNQGEDHDMWDIVGDL